MRYAAYTILNLECCKFARMRFHCANSLVVLRSCAVLREHWWRSCGETSCHKLHPSLWCYCYPTSYGTKICAFFVKFCELVKKKHPNCDCIKSRLSFDGPLTFVLGCSAPRRWLHDCETTWTANIYPLSSVIVLFYQMLVF